MISNDKLAAVLNERNISRWNILAVPGHFWLILGRWDQLAQENAIKEVGLDNRQNVQSDDRIT
jgi:hypothetical protein